MNIDFALIKETNDSIETYEEEYRKIIEETCRQLAIIEDIEISCILVNNQRIHEINKEYRHIDRPTDVISFALEDEEPLLLEGIPRCLGDIFISVEKAKQQAEEYGHSMQREMCFLFTHGLLHLLGFDHMEEEDENIMLEKQNAILQVLQIGR